MYKDTIEFLEWLLDAVEIYKDANEAPDLLFSYLLYDIPADELNTEKALTIIDKIKQSAKTNDAFKKKSVKDYLSNLPLSYLLGL